MDKKYMLKALELAKLGEGKVNPNPMVGAVVVKNGEVVGEGFHEFYGGKHAETVALENAGDKAKGGTLYVTLEPCSHHGKTPPCALNIIKHEIKRCVVATLDPNPLVAGKGIDILRNAGVEVEIGVMESESKELNRHFLKYIETNIPFLFLKTAITLDGKIATKSGNSKWITNEISRNKVQSLRNKYMGIMVGINTVILDDPSLDARIENGVNPYRIIIDPKLRIPLDRKLLKHSDSKNIIVTSSENITNINYKKLLEMGVRFILLEGHDFKIEDILKEIGKLKIDSVILEGGSYLISKAFEEKAFDGGEIFIAPKILGDNEALSFVKGFNFENISDAFELKNTKVNIYGDNMSVEFYK